MGKSMNVYEKQKKNFRILKIFLWKAKDSSTLFIGFAAWLIGWQVITSLLLEHGQGGACAKDDPRLAGIENRPRMSSI